MDREEIRQVNLNWLPAVNRRHSCRSYDNSRPLEEATQARLSTACSSFRPFASARVEFVSDPSVDIFTNALGFYGNISKAPAFFAFIGDTSDPNVQEKVGYTGEGMILEATSLGLGTCWVALTYKSKSVLSMLRLGSKEELLSVSPVGYPMAKGMPDPSPASGQGAGHKRKPLSKMVTGIQEKLMPSWARAAVQAAQLAPSAINRQPWTFEVQDNCITVSVKNKGMEFNVSKRLDCGIAMLHIELGALGSRAGGVWEFLPPPAVARFKLL
jgi:nitroreductase